MCFKGLLCELLMYLNECRFQTALNGFVKLLRLFEESEFVAPCNLIV